MERLIYGLVDPRCGSIRYVGKSTSGLKRPRQHANDKSKTKRGNWIRKLQRLGAPHVIVVIEREPVDLDEAERWWIAAARVTIGDRLINMTEGGDGGGPRSPETRAKISASMKGRVITLEHRAKISAVHKGKTLTPEHCAKIIASLKGNQYAKGSSLRRRRVLKSALR